MLENRCFSNRKEIKNWREGAGEEEKEMQKELRCITFM